MEKNILIDVGVLVTLVAIGAAGYLFSPYLLPKTDLTATPDPGCNLHQHACSAGLPGGGRLELSITPRPIPMMQALHVEVRLTGMDARHVAVDFAGVGMNMGYNRPDLPLIEGERFAGSANLPVCITGSMAWQATVLVETPRQHLSVPFRFTSSPH